jgi:hypothetical protein
MESWEIVGLIALAVGGIAIAVIGSIRDAIERRDRHRY